MLGLTRDQTVGCQQFALQLKCRDAYGGMLQNGIVFLFLRLQQIFGISILSVTYANSTGVTNKLLFKKIKKPANQPTNVMAF